MRLTRAALRRGAEVALVSGPTALEAPAGRARFSDYRGRNARRSVRGDFDRFDGGHHGCGGFDYRPVSSAEKKIKRGKVPIDIRLEPNPDILKDLGDAKDGKC